MAPAQVELLESLLVIPDAVECARQAVRWLATHTAVQQVVCAGVSADEAALVTLASHPKPSTDARTLLLLENRHHPFVEALYGGAPILCSAVHSSDGLRADAGLDARPDTSFHAIPLGTLRPDRGPAAGLLILSPGQIPLDPTVKWLANVVGEKLVQLKQNAALKDAQGGLAREHTLLYSIINAVTDPILLTDTEGRLIIANTRAESLFAATEEESEGRRSAVRLNNILLSSALASSVIESTGPSRRELLLADPIDGSDLLFEVLSALTRSPREGTGFVSVLRNVSDLRRATEEIEENYHRLRIAEEKARAERDRLDLIIDSVADPIVVTDAGGDISMMNAPAQRLFTLTSGSGDAAGRHVQANDAHFSSFISGLLSGDDQRRAGEVGLVEPSTGELLPVEAMAGKILSEHGELIAIATTLHDRREAIERGKLYEQLKRASLDLEAKVQAATAELAEQNERLRRQAIELEQASALKTQFLANVSHELRTPLNAILGYTHMLMHGVSRDGSAELTASQQRQLERIDSNARHLLGIISEILDISRIESGRMPLRLTSFKVGPLIEEVLAELEPIISRSKLKVTTALAPTLPALRSDRQKVKQIVLNLLSNALKFTPQGSVQIVGRSERAPRAVSIDVIDTGIGIPASEQDRIFEDFRQLDNSPTRAYGGTGLGLSICRRLATILGGKISVRSEVDKGSTFTLRLPVRTTRR